MKKTTKIISLLGIVAMAMLSSCSFLDVDRYFEDTFQQDSIFHSQKNAEAYLWHTPARYPDPGSIWGQSWYPGELASDEMTVRWQTGEFWGAQFSIGRINERNVPNASLWGNMYWTIQRCNKMLQNIDLVADMPILDKQRYKGYVHFMRGYAYYHLLMNWGPCLIVGDDVLPNSLPAEDYDKERATYDETVDYICEEFTKAAQVLPHPRQQSISFSDRPTKGAALALIARLRLYQASPLWNGGDAARQSFGSWKRKSDGKFYVNQNYDPNRWAVAAAAAKAVIDLNFYELHVVDEDPRNPFTLPDNVPPAKFPDGAGGIDPYLSFANMFNGETLHQMNKEFIWAMASGNVTGYSRHSFPVYYGGWGGMSVPKRVVDCFLMADGKTIREPSGDYPYIENPKETVGKDKKISTYILKGSAPKMFDNREMRFYASIGFPGSFWPMNSASQDPGYTLKQFWFSKDDNSGITGAGSNPNDYNVSGFTPIKYIHPDDSYANGKGNVKTAFITSPKPFPIIRYAEVLLQYIEALNNVEGTVSVETVDEQGEIVKTTVTRDMNEMKKYFNLIRYRVGLPGVTDVQLADKAELQKIIMNERQIELFNEGYRYFDTRRWGIYLDNDANTSNWQGFDVYRERTNANNNEGFWNVVSIDEQNIRDRIAKPRMVLLPIPHDELLKVPAMDQNPGWDR